METESNSDSKRKLASVQVVDSVRKHPNADKLEIASILGWEVITRINEVKQAQVVVYCEVDALLPVNADWLPPAVKDLIADQSKDLQFFRVKTRKLRGELSQGLIVTVVPLVPLADLPVGTDLTDILGIEKFSRHFFVFSH
jgi:RNA ligase (TIGR02306 family)